MRKVAILVVVIMMAITNAAFAGMESGDKEIQVQGAVSNETNSENDNSDSSTTVQLTFNYFFSSNISIGGTYWGYSTVSDDGAGNESTYTSNYLLLRGDFYLGSATSKAVPYIGLHGGQNSFNMESGDFEWSGSSSAVGFHGGLKIFATENASWNLEFNSTTTTRETESGLDEIEYNTTQFLVGFSYYF